MAKLCMYSFIVMVYPFCSGVYIHREQAIIAAQGVQIGIWPKPRRFRLLFLPEFIEVVNNYDATRKKWLHAELELKRHKALLLKSDIAQAALEVKLKHCRNQVDVEIKKRYKAEADFQYLVWLLLTLLHCPIGTRDLHCSKSLTFTMSWSVSNSWKM